MKWISAIFLLLIAFSANAQRLVEEKFYTDKNIATIRKIVKDSNSYYCLTANINGNGRILKLNNNLDTIWASSCIDEIGEDGDLIKIEQNKYMASSSHTTFDSDDPRNIILTVIDTSGAFISNDTIGVGANDNEAYTIIQMPDKGYMILGSTGNFNWPIETTYNLQYALYRLDSIGNVLWSKEYGLRSADQDQNMIQCNDGSFLICGETPLSNSVFHPTLVKVKPDGTLIKLDSIIITNYSTHEYFGPSNIIQTIDGGFVLEGYYEAGGSYKGYVVKLDSSFNIQWIYNDFINPENLFDQINQLRDSSFIVIGFSGVAFASPVIYHLSKTGNLISKKVFQSANCKEAAYYSMLIEKDSTLLACGHCTDKLNGVQKGYIVKFDSLGSAPYTPTASSYCNSLPTPDFIAKQDTNDFSITYFNTSSSGLAYGEISVSKWKFADSTTSNQMNPLRSPGILKDSVWARLAVTNNLGCKNTIEKKVKVIYDCTLPVPAFSAVQNNDSVYFTNASTGNNIASYQWKFADSTTSALLNPRIKVTGTPDSVWARLTVKNSYGCDSTITKKFKFSTVTSVTTPQTSLKVSVFPNPFSQSTIFKMNNNSTSSYQLSILNSLGEEISSYNFSGKEFTLNASTFPSGLYLYVLRDGEGKMKSGKLVVE